jgi:dihydrofolate reductase
MISIIAAIGKNRELGKDNKLLWHIPEDFKRFKDLTSNHVVIMGRKTYESLPEKFRPLPNRVNIVISRRSNESNETNKSNLTYWVNSMEAAFAKASASQGEIFIIGGASIYEQGIKYADRLYLTLVEKEFPEADTFFPDYSQFKKIISEEKHQDDIYTYRFIELDR